MVENKKAFVLYVSWLEKIEELNNHDAGVLFKKILNYVNNSPVFEYMSDNVNNIYLDIVNQIEYEWSKFNPKTGKYHWNYKGGITDKNKAFRNSTIYKIWRNDVFKRDNYTCMICGEVGGELNAHHIKHFATHIKLRTELSNGITLCKTCHKEEHKNG